MGVEEGVGEGVGKGVRERWGERYPYLLLFVFVAMPALLRDRIQRNLSKLARFWRRPAPEKHSRKEAGQHDAKAGKDEHGAVGTGHRIAGRLFDDDTSRNFCRFGDGTSRLLCRFGDCD